MGRYDTDRNIPVPKVRIDYNKIVVGPTGAIGVAEPFDYRRLIYHEGDTLKKSAQSIDKQIEMGIAEADRLQVKIETHLAECRAVFERLGM